MDPQDNKPTPAQPGQDNVTPTPAEPAKSHPDRSAAAEVLRGKIDSIYEQDPPNQLAKDQQQSPYDRTLQNNQNYDWQQYHTAWQQYYNQYYQRYYLQQLHVQRQQQMEEKAQAATEAPGATDELVQQPAVETSASKAKELKQQLLGTVKERASKLRRSNHFWPIMSAVLVAVVFIFLQYNRAVFAEVKAYISPGSVVNENDTVLVDPTANVDVGPEPKLIIPKINVNIHVVYDITSLEDGPVQEGLNRGVVHYKLPGANALPGQIGNTVILGHSSNDIFDPGDYKFAFVLLDRLTAGDIIYMHYEGKRYIYRVTEKKVILPSEFNALQVNNGKPMLTLVTCTPPGTALKRLLVYAEQISPDPATATQGTAGNSSSSDDVGGLPGNSPTLLERIRDFFFP